MKQLWRGGIPLALVRHGRKGSSDVLTVVAGVVAEEAVVAAEEEQVRRRTLSAGRQMVLLTILHTF